MHSTAAWGPRVSLKQNCGARSVCLLCSASISVSVSVSVRFVAQEAEAGFRLVRGRETELQDEYARQLTALDKSRVQVRRRAPFLVVVVLPGCWFWFLGFVAGCVGADAGLDCVLF